MKCWKPIKYNPMEGQDDFYNYEVDINWRSKKFYDYRHFKHVDIGYETDPNDRGDFRIL